MKEVNDLLERLGELEEAPLIWINKKVYDMAQEIKILKEEYMILQNASDEVEEEKDKEIERLREEKESWKRVATKNFNEAEDYKSIIKEVREYIKENQEEHKYIDRGGFTYTEGHFLRDSDTLLEILDKADNNV